MMKQRWGLDRNNVLRPTPGDPWGVEHHHWNTGAKQNQQLNPQWAKQQTKKKKKAPAPTNWNKSLYVGAIIESDARPTGVQLKREAKLLTVIGLNTKHADCRIIFGLNNIYSWSIYTYNT